MNRFFQSLRMPRSVYLICMNYLITHFGFYALTAILTIYLSQVKGYGISEVATIMLIFTVTYRSARFLTGPLLDNINPKFSMVGGCFIVGFSVLAVDWVNSPLLVTLLLITVGLGYSIRGLAAKSSASYIGSQDGNALTYFSNINLFVNVAVMVGPLIGTYMYNSSFQRYTFKVIAAFYIIAGLHILFSLSSKGLTDQNRPNVKFWTGYKSVLQDREFRKVFWFNIIGCFFIAQVMNTLPLFLSEQLHMKDEIGWYLTAFGLLIILAQLPVTWLLKTYLSGNYEKFRIPLVLLLFSVGFLLYGLFGAMWGVGAFIVFLAVAEAIFVPTMDTAVSDCATPDLRTTYWSIIGISMAIGDGAGSYIGLRLLEFWDRVAYARLYFTTMAVLAIVALLLSRLFVRSSGSVELDNSSSSVSS